ncbi:type VII secretion-associated serine protease mycosin [Streptomyces sp. HM190]|uniref:type VII secretion-associated serine protease mycosin n=1 Tax=Streptomyces sp. HM190 TaxID=2695266 RepID=UPI00135C933E|nr:type VII secretion-associated serine protease mycosin [Streptomyces sp. HM190]
MRTTSTPHGCHRVAAAAVLGLLLVGAEGSPAYAESTREQQWFLDAMQAEQMWRTSTGKGITVAVIDTGVDPTNPDLKGRILAGKDYAEGQPGDEHTDYEGHGTGMAGLIAGTGGYRGGKGAFGLAPGAKILPIRMPKVDTAENKAQGNRWFNEAAPKAIRYAVDSGAQVINLSLGHTQGSPQLTEAVKYALEEGALIFAAVGNSGDKGNLVEYPAATPGVVGVGAIGKDLHKTAESQYGPQVDMAAPGDDLIHACGSATGLCDSHGTSGASALASASAALIWSKHPTWTNNQVLRVMLNTIGAPTDGAKRNDSIGYGIVRPRVALTNPGDPGPADEYPLPDLAAAASASPSPEPSSVTDATDPPAKDKSAEETSSDADTTPLVWILLGAAALAVALLGVIATVLVRKRRAANPVAPFPPVAYSPGQPENPSASFPNAPHYPPPTSGGNVPPGRGPDAV